MLTGLLSQSSTCAAACVQAKNVPRSTRATRALPALPCGGVPTAERRKTALSRPITIALSDTSVPFAVVCPSISDTCVQPSAEANPLPWLPPPRSKCQIPQLHVVSVSISLYGHRAGDSLGAGDYKSPCAGVVSFFPRAGVCHKEW